MLEQKSEATTESTSDSLQQAIEKITAAADRRRQSVGSLYRLVVRMADLLKQARNEMDTRDQQIQELSARLDQEQSRREKVESELNALRDTYELMASGLTEAAEDDEQEAEGVEHVCAGVEAVVGHLETYGLDVGDADEILLNVQEVVGSDGASTETESHEQDSQGTSTNDTASGEDQSNHHASEGAVSDSSQDGVASSETTEAAVEPSKAA